LRPLVFLINIIFRRCILISVNDLMINEEIRDREVRVITDDGSQLGIMAIADAQRLAEEKNLDLVKIAPQGNPPVCKIMDYGKYRFELMKREKEARKNQKVIELKEVRLSATIDTHDLEVKAKAVRRFLADGNKIKAAIRFRGRQATHSEIGVDVMKTFYEMISDVAVIDKQPKLEGRNMTMFLSAKPEVKSK
jgi:translation initiation factor IF-3